MKINVCSSTSPVASDAVEELMIGLKDQVPSLLILYGTANHDYLEVVDRLSKTLPQTKIAGSTTCLGVMTSNGFISENATAIGAMSFNFESKDAFGVGISQESEPINCAFEACTKSLAAANREGELPSLIWLMCSPGKEEEHILGIEKLVGKSVPIYGGSSADNDLSGKWKIFTDQEQANNGVLVVSFFDSDLHPAVSSFHCGYQASSKQGTITKAQDRTLLEIDGRPAFEVYNSWTSGAIEQRKVGDSILGDTTYFPLGRNREEVRGIPFYLLSHPATVTEHGGLSLFTDVKVGEVICMMEGSLDSLVKRAVEVVNSILKREQIGLKDVSGALIVYCAGCMLAVNEQNKMNEVAANLKATLGNVPFMGVFTFGEQGSMLGKNNLHGNLMISVTLFRR